MQDDLWGFCTGFFLARSTNYSKNLIQKSINYLKNPPFPWKNDQHAFNEEYKKIKTFGFPISKLPLDEYPNGDVYFNQGKKLNAKIVHSNYLTTTAEQVARFKEHNMWDESDNGFNMVNKYYV